MSENTNTTKKPTIYVPGTSIKKVDFSDGNSVIRLSLNLEKFAPFVKEHKKANGYINFNLYPRKETGPYGDNFSMSLDQWEPNKDKAVTATKKSVEKKITPKPAPAPQENSNDEEFI